jgi:hypothetical protein
MTEFQAGWESNKEKLLCFVLLNDAIAQRLVPGAAPAYWRAFIVQNRETGQILARMRFKQPDGSRNWTEIVPTIQNDQTLQDIRCKLEDVFRIATSVFGIYPDNAIKCFYPPDDNGDPGKTLIWLEQRDLVEITRIEPKGDK